MSKCDVEIEFDRSSRTFVPGEAVSGKVHVTANKDVASNGVKVEVLWRTHGRGNRAGETLDTISISGEQLPAGHRRSYTFSFKAPDGPLTYHGRYLNVDQYIRARVDIPWAFDPKAEVEYILLGNPAGESHFSDPGITCTGSSYKASWSGLLFFVVIATIVTFAAYPLGALSWLLVVSRLFKMLRDFLVSRKVGATSFHLDKSHASPGQTVKMTLECSPSGPMQLNTIAATLKAREIVISGSETNRSTHTHTVHDEQFIICEGAQLNLGPQTLEGSITIPETEAWTFQASSNVLKWTLTVRVDISGWPDWVGDTEITVVPGPA